MRELEQFDEPELPAPEQVSAADAEASEAVMAERLNPFMDTILNKVDIPTIEEELGLPKAEELLHKVAEAAEKNQAIEALLERSHEVKDEQGITGQKINTLPTETEPSQLPRSADPSISNDTFKHADTNHKSGGILSSNNLYGQAIRYGVVAGLCALSLAIIATLLFTYV